MTLRFCYEQSGGGACNKLMNEMKCYFYSSNIYHIWRLWLLKSRHTSVHTWMVNTTHTHTVHSFQQSINRIWKVLRTLWDTAADSEWQHVTKFTHKQMVGVCDTVLTADKEQGWASSARTRLGQVSVWRERNVWCCLVFGSCSHCPGLLNKSGIQSYTLEFTYSNKHSPTSLLA